MQDRLLFLSVLCGFSSFCCSVTSEIVSRRTGGEAVYLPHQRKKLYSEEGRELGSYRSQSIYQLHIQLEEIEPAIWRRIIVPGKISLARLHRLLQPAMGWENYHLHLFTIGGVRYGEPDPEYADEGFQVKHDRYASVRDVLRTEGMRFRYDHDFGDDWRHDVLVERIEVLDAEDWVVPRCLDGRRACPPEDCGGVSGYEALLEALRDPGHEDHERLRTWVGDHYDPELFSVQQLNSAFALE